MYPEPNESTLVPFHEGGLAVNASLHRPVRLALVPRGCGGPATPPCEIYFGDSGHHCVRRIDAQGNLTTVVNGPPGPDTSPVAGNSGDGGQARRPPRDPGRAARSAERDRDRRRQPRPHPLLRSAGDTIRAFAGTGEGGYGGDGGPAARALLDRPTGLAVDGGGNLFVADHNNFVLRRVAADASRTITTFAGTGERGAGGNGGPAGAAQFEQPTGLAFTPAGDLLVSDARAEVVRRIDPSGTIFPFAGQAYVQAFAGDDGPATAAATCGVADNRTATTKEANRTARDLTLIRRKGARSVTPERVRVPLLCSRRLGNAGDGRSSDSDGAFRPARNA
jgi:hypothetical protein